MKVRSAQGLAQVAGDALETVLFNLVRPWLIRDNTPVLVSGLAASPQQYSVPASPLPCRPDALSPRPLDSADARLSLHAVPGLWRSDERDAILTHDSLIRGVATEMPDFTGVICIPDERTQWVAMQEGEITGAVSFMTVELTDLLAPQKSDLLPAPGPELDEQSFNAAVSAAVDTPERTAQQLVAARSDSDPARSRLKGLLIGMELASARDLWQGARVLIANGSPWSTLYAAALTRIGATAHPCERDAMTLAGLTQAYRRLCETVA